MNRLRNALGPFVFLLWIATSGMLNAQSATASNASPEITSKAALGGAQIVSLSSSAARATMFYTLDGSAPTSAPTSASIAYLAPFLVTSNVTIKALAVQKDGSSSSVSTKLIAAHVLPAALIWSDEFDNRTSNNQQPNPTLWGYNTGHDGNGNHELEHYCAWGSAEAPCDPAQPNAFVGPDGYLHILARQSSKEVYTSARLRTENLFSFQYGRLEARIKSPEAQGMWPAFWTLGNNTATTGWPGAGEQDIMERVNAALDPDWNEGSIHGTGFTGDVGLGTKYFFPRGETAAGWHTYGMIWKKGSIAFYVDDPAKPYVTYTNPESIAEFKDGVWPFDGGDSAYIILNLAVGGDWPKSPDAKTPFPAELLVDYVRLYAN
jgi:beta-glucanase (GH16 family)